MNRGRVGEVRGGKETDGCPLTLCLTIPYCTIDNLPIHSNNTNMHTILLLMSHSSIYLDPCLYAYSLEADPPISVPTHSHGC
jgi:hypothetical protein